MNEQEFDKFADEYLDMHRKNIRLSGEEPDFFSYYKVKDLVDGWARTNPDRSPAHILDFGGGTGGSAPHMRRLFPDSNITLADVSRRSLEIARSCGIKRLNALCFDGKILPLKDDSFDIGLAACVFHHIPEECHIHLLSEIRRVLKPGGQLFVFEHNPWNPFTVHAVNTCPFDKNAILIAAPKMRERMQAAGFSNVAVTYRLFFPGPLRRLRGLEPWLGRLAVGAQYRSVGAA
ncbi:class I SAM-dependent methyltransferase [Thiorhodovibrio winogradskyi]|nr:class I SAM-dependent methyltransferase [Thiorhodovibrio winogradskyi]